MQSKIGFIKNRSNKDLSTVKYTLSHLFKLPSLGSVYWYLLDNETIWLQINFISYSFKLKVTITCSFIMKRAPGMFIPDGNIK